MTNRQKKPNLAVFFFVRFCDNVSCVSLGRAHRPRVAVAACGPESLVRKSSPLDTGRHSNHSNQHKREQEGPGLVATRGLLGRFGGREKKEVNMTSSSSSLHHEPHSRSFINSRGSTCRPPPSAPALCCVGGCLTFPALPGGSSLESWVILRGRQRTHSDTVGGFT